MSAPDGEPWVHLETGADLAAWGKPEEVAYNQINRQRQKLDFFRNAFDFLTDNRVAGDYLEFGCHRARTFRMALTEARKHNLDQMKFWAFDSFEGLPEPKTATSVEIWTKGALKTEEVDFHKMVRDHGIYVDQITTVKGFYDDTLTADGLSAHVLAGRSAALITVDCDLYESALPVFKFIEPLLQNGTVIYIDDYSAGYRGHPFRGVSKAFKEYCSRSAWRFTPHMHVGWWGRSFIAYQA